MTRDSFDALEVRRALSDPRRLIEQLDLADGAKRQGGDGLHIRCPWHAEDSASCSVTRGRDGTVRVRCFGCGQTGDALHLVAAAHSLCVDRDFARVISLAAELAGVAPRSTTAHVAPRPAPPPPSPPAYPPLDEVDALWEASHAANRTMLDPHELDMAACFYFAGRGWFAPDVAALDLARVTPLPSAYTWPTWWPTRWTDTYRLVTRAYDARGIARSLHARAIVPGADPKVRCPLGYAFDLVLAGPTGAAMLRGEYLPENVALVEGLADTIAMSLAVADGGAPVAVIGMTAGSMATLKAIAWPAGVPVIVLTHDDDAGNRYAARIREAIPATVRVLRGDMSRLLARKEVCDGRH